MAGPPPRSVSSWWPWDWVRKLWDALKPLLKEVWHHLERIGRHALDILAMAHGIPLADIRAWLREHGVDTDQLSDQDIAELQKYAEAEFERVHGEPPPQVPLPQPSPPDSAPVSAGIDLMGLLKFGGLVAGSIMAIRYLTKVK